MERGAGPLRKCLPERVSVGSDDGFIDYLTLVRDRQTMLRGQLTELLMSKMHDYRIRMIIKR